MNHNADAINWKQFIIKCKVEESCNLCSFYLTPLGANKVRIHKPGQYVPVRIYNKSTQQFLLGNFSISSAPNEEYYRITITSTGFNPLERYLTTHVEEGFEIEVGEPFGSFVLRENTNNKVFICDALGQAPLLSMLEALDLKESLTENIIWISHFEDIKTQAFRDKINYIENNCSTVQTHLFCNSLKDVELTTNVYKGAVDLNKIQDWELDCTADYYVSGSKSFVESLLDFLAKEEIKTSQLHFENIPTSQNN